MMKFFLASALVISNCFAFNISTAKKEGNYYKIIKNLKDKYPNEMEDVFVDTSNGSMENAQRLSEKTHDGAIIQSDVVADNRDKDIKSVMNLYTEYAHIMVNKTSNINRLNDLSFKNVNIGTKGSGTQAFAQKVFKNIRNIRYTFFPHKEAMEKLKNGEIDAMIIVSGVPANLIKDNFKDKRLKMLNLRKDEVAILIENINGISIAKIPARTYGFHNKITTFGVGAHMMTKADADDNTVYKLTKILWNEKAKNYKYISGKLDPRLDSFSGLKISLHPGALRFYKEMVAAY